MLDDRTANGFSLSCRTVSGGAQQLPTQALRTLNVALPPWPALATSADMVRICLCVKFRECVVGNAVLMMFESLRGAAWGGSLVAWVKISHLLVLPYSTPHWHLEFLRGRKRRWVFSIFRHLLSAHVPKRTSAAVPLSRQPGPYFELSGTWDYGMLRLPTLPPAINASPSPINSPRILCFQSDQSRA